MKANLNRLDSSSIKEKILSFVSLFPEPSRYDKINQVTKLQFKAKAFWRKKMKKKNFSPAKLQKKFHYPI